MTKGPAKSPCGSCPYRRDVPSGIWDESEYAKLPRYDGPTGEQPPRLFLCHQQDGRVCAGWAGCHDMAENMAIRIAAISGSLVGTEFDATFDYVSPVPLFSSGAEAAEHGRAQIAEPEEKTIQIIDKIARKRGVRA